MRVRELRAVEEAAAFWSCCEVRFKGGSGSVEDDGDGESNGKDEDEDEDEKR